MTSTPTLRRGSFFRQLPRKSHLLASGGSSSSLTQSRFDFVPSTTSEYRNRRCNIQTHIASLLGSADRHSLTLQSDAFTYKTAATGDPLWPNSTRSCSHLDCERSPIKYHIRRVVALAGQHFADLHTHEDAQLQQSISAPKEHEKT